LSLEKDGFEGEALQDAVDKYIDNGLLEIEAKKIRNTIDKAIVGEQNKETQSTVDADAKQQQEHAESVKQLEEHISKTDTMFGFKMAKDEESLKQVQQGHAKYITSGKFLDDVFESQESLAEAAWFVKNKSVIIKAIANKNLQKGKQAVLDDIREPEVVSPQRFRDPEGSNEFDPSKFSAKNEYLK
jgi:regulator of replication initiation timing